MSKKKYLSQKESLKKSLKDIQCKITILKEKGCVLDKNRPPKLKECTKNGYEGKIQITYYLEGDRKPHETKGYSSTEAAHFYHCLISMLTDSKLENTEMEQSKLSLTELYMGFLEEDKIKLGLKASSYRAYKDVWWLYLEPFYRNLKISDLTYKKMGELRMYIDKLKKNENFTSEKSLNMKRNKNGDTLSSSKKQEIWRLNKKFINRLQAEGLIKTNILDGFKGFKKNVGVNTDGFWKNEEFNQFIKNVPDERYKLFYMISFYCGLRRGEVLALRFSDIDFELKKCKITRNYQVRENGFSTTKTDSVRQVYLPVVVLDKIREFKENASCRISCYGDESLILSRNEVENIPLSHTTVTRKMLEGIKASGVKRIKVHTLRNSFITNAIKRGCNPDAVRIAAGHKNIQMTMGVYLRSDDEDLKEVAEIYE